MGKVTSPLKYKSIFLILSSILLISGLFLFEKFFDSDNLETLEINSEVINSVSSQNLMANMPLRFIPNKGQAGTDAEYHVQAAGHTVLFHDEKIVLRREESKDKKNEIVLEFKEANKNPIIEGNERLPGVANFFKGSDPTKWQTNLPTYSSLKYEELYPGIDMSYIGEEGNLESEFYVSARTDYHKIKIEYSGIKSKRIRDDGALLLETELGELIEKAPYAYQDIDGVREEVEAEYTLLADACIGFELGQYNRDFLVVIDPELVFMNFIDHSSGGWTSAVAFDNVGNLVFAGASNRFFPATDVIDSSNHEGGSNDDGLLLKVDAATGEVIYSALFGGGKQDSFNDIAIDDLGNIYLVGMTASKNFPVLNALQDTIGGSHDAFLSILNSNGELTYSTYLGGTRTDWALDIALDGTGNIFMAGRTVSPDFPVVNAFQDTIMGEEKYGEYNGDIFLAKVNSTGDLSYATYLGGSKSDRVKGIAVNNSGELTITGSTDSHDFPLMNAYQDSNTSILNWETAMYITRLNSGGNGLIYSTYFGGAGNDWASGIDVVANGETYISGNTTSEDFPVIGGDSFPEADSSDGVLISMDNSGQPILSLRSNVPGSEYFIGMARQNDSTLLFMSEDDDSLRIYEKKDDTFFEEIFSFNSDGHSINAIEFGDGSLAFASTYWGTGLGKTASVKTNGSIDQMLSFAQAGFGKILLDQFHIFLVNGCLEIRAKPGKDVNITLGVNEGYVTLTNSTHGTEATLIKADEVFCINITCNEKLTQVFWENVTRANFRFIPETGRPIKVDFSNGNGRLGSPNLVIGSPHFGNEIILGKGPTIVRSGEMSDRIDASQSDDEAVISCGGGADEVIVTKESEHKIFLGEGNDKITFVNTKKSILAKNSNLNQTDGIMVLKDSLGIDTLDISLLESGLTLDISLQNSAQTINSAGTQVLLQGNFEVVIGTDYDDEITVSPLPDTARHVDGRDGSDILNFNAGVPGSVDDGSTITTPGFADVTYVNIETVNLSVITGTEEAVDMTLPVSYGLSNNYPNPFNPSTKIKYQLPSNVNSETTNVELIVFDILGREISTLVNEQQKPGYYEIDFHASHLTSGIYFYRIQAGEFVDTKKMILLR